MAMDLSFVLHETHTRGISALGYNAGRRELVIGYEGTINPLECRGNYGATSNNMKLVHWPLMGGLLHLV